MVNLLPEAAKRQIVTEYYVRVGSVWLALLTAAFLVLTALLAPVWLLVELQQRVYADTFMRVSADNTTYADAEAQVVAANELARELNRVDGVVPLWDDILLLNSLASSAITIESISMARTKGVMETMTVSGVAETRATLAEFRDAIEANERFASADLPLSNLAKDRDITFSITIAFNATAQ